MAYRAVILQSLRPNLGLGQQKIVDVDGLVEISGGGLSGPLRDDQQRWRDARFYRPFLRATHGCSADNTN
jgi:hypothetical protein